MNRFGWLLLGVFALLIGGFIAFSRGGGDAGGQAQRAAAPPATPFAPPVPPAEVAVAPSGLAIPVAGLTALDLTDTFGDARGSGRVHDAIDVVAPRGTPVVAAGDGRVEKLFDSEAGGRTVYVRSPDGRFIHYYAHLDGYAPGMREGQAVRRGQPLGTVGSSGNADPASPHLHFEIKAMAAGDSWHGGRAINPYPLLAGGPTGG